jgi:uncharacterized membrane protein YgcG
MADTGKQSPLGVNVLGSILQNKGYCINKVAASYMGASKSNPGYSFGSLVQGTVLRLQTWGIHDAYNRGLVTQGGGNSVYDNLIYIGFTSIPSLGNAKSPTYLPVDAAGLWTSGGTPASSAWPFSGTTDQAQNASWIPYNTTNSNKSITQWGFIRCYALQAWNEFNYNGSPTARDTPEYKEFCSSLLSANAFVGYSNQAIFAMQDSKQFLVGAYSNINDLISADITGVNLATFKFGQDLINLGKALDLNTISTFGLPSTLLRTLGTNGAITQDLSLALLSTGLSSSDISKIGSGQKTDVTTEQEQQIYGAFLLIQGVNLVNVLAPLLCRTAGLVTLADLLSVRKLFPTSYNSMTVPIYNTAPGPTNSKTYYLIYSGTGINSAINSPAIKEIVGYQIPSGTPPITDIQNNNTNYVLPPKGFGANLIGIIPEDDAVAAGAFSYSMRQVRNVEQAEITKFAQVVFGNESAIGPNFTKASGTDRPVVTEMANYGLTVCAQGSGVYGSFTMSDLFGCMSGLPYPWANLYSSITSLQTQKLHNIYQQNFLAITWEKAQMQLTQPYYYTTVVPYVAPTVSSNPANPTYQPNPALPNYDPYPYVNGSSGAKTYCATYYSAAGQPAQYDWYYTLVIRQTEDGGGYGRGTAPNPTVTISPNNVGASVATVVGRNDQAAASMGGGSFGRVNTSINNGGPYRWLANDVQTNWLNIAGSDTDAASPTPPIIPPRSASWVEANMPIETITIQHPPTATLPVSANGAVATNGTNTSGDVWSRNGQVSSGTNPWPAPMNANIQQYIDQANAEIQAISVSKPTETVNNNTIYRILGTQLTREQRTRYTALPPVPVPKDIWINLYPTSLYVYVDSIPSLAQNTDPHMSAQTLEAISDLETTGGQSTVAMQRQERNQSRLQTVGIPLDNNLNSDMIAQQRQTLAMNGVIPDAVDGVPSGTKNYTLPAWPGTIGDGGELIQPRPVGRMISIGPQIVTDVKPGELTPILNDIPFPVVGPLVPVGPGDNIITYPTIGQIPDFETEGDPTRIPNGGGTTIAGGDPSGGGGGGGGGTSGSGGGTSGGGGSTNQGGGNTPTGNTPNTGGGTPGSGLPNNNAGGIVIVTPPGFGTPLGKPTIPTNLNPIYTSSTMLPSSPSVQEAIENVIECNCDCWIT